MPGPTSEHTSSCSAAEQPTPTSLHLPTIPPSSWMVGRFCSKPQKATVCTPNCCGVAGIDDHVQTPSKSSKSSRHATSSLKHSMRASLRSTLSCAHPSTCCAILNLSRLGLDSSDTRPCCSSCDITLMALFRNVHTAYNHDGSETSSWCTAAHMPYFTVYR